MKVLKWILGLLVIGGIVAFFVTTHVLAKQHGQSMVQEWQTWFGILKDTEEVVETTRQMMIFKC